MTTVRPVQPSGSACWKCASSGLQAPEQPRQRPRHAQLLRPRGQLDRLDAVGHELGEPRHRGEAAGRARAAGSSRSRFDTCVSSPVRARPSTSASRTITRAPRRPPRVARATSAHEATRRGSGAERARDAVADRGDVGRVDVGRVVAGELGHRAAGARHDRAAAGERLGHGDAEALVERGVDEAARAAVQRARAPRRRPRRAARRSRAARRCPSRARRRRAARRRRRPRSGRGSCAARASRPRARSRPRPAGPSGVKTSSTAFGTTRIFSAGTASSSTSSRFVNSETAITRVAARTTRGTARRE